MYTVRDIFNNVQNIVKCFPSRASVPFENCRRYYSFYAEHDRALRKFGLTLLAWNNSWLCGKRKRTEDSKNIWPQWRKISLWSYDIYKEPWLRSRIRGVRRTLRTHVVVNPTLRLPKEVTEVSFVRDILHTLKV